MKKIDLNGVWQLESDWLKKKAIPANVPGDNLSALVAAKAVADPYWGKNELDMEFLGNTDWTYTRTVDVPASFLDEASVYLHFDSIDTFGNVYINGKLVGKTENQFRRYRFEVKKYLVAGKNEISVSIDASIRRSTAENKKMP